VSQQKSRVGLPARNVLATMLAKRAPGYTGLGFSDPRRLALTPSASTDG